MDSGGGKAYYVSNHVLLCVPQMEINCLRTFRSHHHHPHRRRRRVVCLAGNVGLHMCKAINLSLGNNFNSLSLCATKSGGGSLNCDCHSNCSSPSHRIFNRAPKSVCIAIIGVNRVARKGIWVRNKIKFGSHHFHCQPGVCILYWNFLISKLISLF